MACRGHEYGWATAVHGFASLAAPALILLLRRVRPTLAAQLVVVVPLVAVALAPTWTVALPPLLLLGAGLTMVECRTTRMLQLGAPPRYLALALGVADAALIAAAMLAAMAAPALIDVFGPHVLLLVVAAACAAALGWGLRAQSARRGVADDRGLELEAEPAVQGDGGAAMLLNGQVDVALRGGLDDPAADRDQAGPRPAPVPRASGSIAMKSR